jgi:hypothetical protein
VHAVFNTEIEAETKIKRGIRRTQMEYTLSLNRIGIAIGYGVGRSGLDCRQRQDGFLFSIASRPALGPNHPPIQWVPGGPVHGKKQPERQSDS